MVVKTNWPGATAREVEQQVTDRIERKLQELPLEWVRSYSKPGESLVFVVVSRLAAVEGDRRAAVPGAQEDRRHPQHAAAGHPGSVLQRRVRRHLHEHLRDHRRRLRLSRARRFRRPHPRGAAARAGRGEGRQDRRAGREDLHRAFQQQARNARRRARADPAVARGAERRRRGRRVRDRDRPHLRPARRATFDSRRCDPRLLDPREQPRSSGSATSPRCAAATSIRRSRRCAGTAARRSALGITMARAAT